MNVSAQALVVIPCTDFDVALAYFTETLRFRIDRISPADKPREADLSGHGLALLLRRSDNVDTGTIRLPVAPTDLGVAAGVQVLTAPNGTRVEFVQRDDVVHIPPTKQSLVISRIAESADFGTGRAGMGYRDLIPDRQGGRFIASHIRIAEGGEVPDYAHFHKIRFQMIFCYKGWVRVAYEDQGDPIVMNPGDCVLQPPEIRHRVLESSAGLEVIEIGCPAEHDTYADHEITLPTGIVDPDRDFGGQRFVLHVAATADWVPWRFNGWECRDIGIGEATDGLAGARVARPVAEVGHQTQVHDGEFVFMFVLDGQVDMVVGEHSETLAAGDSIVIPAGEPHGLSSVAPDTSILEVTLPAEIPLPESGAT